MKKTILMVFVLFAVGIASANMLPGCDPESNVCGSDCTGVFESGSGDAPWSLTATRYCSDSDSSSKEFVESDASCDDLSLAGVYGECAGLNEFYDVPEEQRTYRCTWYCPSFERNGNVAVTGGAECVLIAGDADCAPNKATSMAQFNFSNRFFSGVEDEGGNGGAYGGIPEIGNNILSIIGLIVVIAVAGFFIMKKK